MTKDEIIMNMKWIKDLQKVVPESRYSQMGEESIIDFIFKSIQPTNRFYVDIGAGDGFQLSNVRNLINQGWTGLMVDANNKGNKEVKQHLVNADNICDILKLYKVPKIFDFLSLDIDGNDLYVLKSILSNYKPRVFIVEFNGTLPVEACISIKYNENHKWNNDNYYGASFKAFNKIARMNDYVLIYQLYSTNLFFIKADLIGGYQDFGISYTPQQYHPKANYGEWVQI